MAINPTHCPKLPWMIDFHASGENKVLNSQLRAAYAENFTEHLIELNVDSQAPITKLTGIICTLGKDTNEEMILNMIEAGMSMVRIKMCHVDHDECKNLVSKVRSAVDNYSKIIGRIYSLAIGFDIRGPEIRTGNLKDTTTNEITLVKGQNINLTTNPEYEENVDTTTIYVDYKKTHEVVKPDDKIYIDYGKIQLSVKQIVGNVIKCSVEDTGVLFSRTSVNIPQAPIDLPDLTDKDRDDIQLALEIDADLIFLSEMRRDETFQEIKDILGKKGEHVMIVTKIGSYHALCNIDAVIKRSDGILINRGVLGTELPLEKLFLAQKSITARCNKIGKPVICASPILESMIERTRPSKSEVLDIANAVLDGIDCFLLSRETTIGERCVQSVSTLTTLCKEAEAAIYQKEVFANLMEKVFTPIEPLYAILISAIDASLKCNAAAIVIMTTSGRSAKILSSYRPRCPIVAVTRFGHVARKLNLFRGVYPIQYIKRPSFYCMLDIKERIKFGLTCGKALGFIKGGDAVIIVTSSKPCSGFTSALKIVYASEYDAFPM